MEASATIPHDPAMLGGLGVAAGTRPGVAWLTSIDGTLRVVGAIPATAPARVLGPRSGGEDENPTMVASSDDAVWVVATRTTLQGSRLWSRRWISGRWDRPDLLGSSAFHDRRATLASSGDELWMAWIRRPASGTRAADTLVASKWTGSGWSPAEILPPTSGAPMAPSIAVDDQGGVAVTWAADDGKDAEVFVSTRHDGGWSMPVALSSNEVPDLEPTVAAGEQEWIVAWESFRDGMYVSVAATGSIESSWTAPREISHQPANGVRVVAADGRVSATWGSPDVRYRGGTRIWSATRYPRRRPGDEGSRIARSWGEPRVLAGAHGSARATALDDTGRLLLAWRGPDGKVRLARTRRIPGTSGSHGNPLKWLRGDRTAMFSTSVVETPSLPPGAAAAEAFDGTIPTRYMGFGDSITEGVIQPTPHNPILTNGYPVPLMNYLASLLDTNATVVRRPVVASSGPVLTNTGPGAGEVGALWFFNEGVGGEKTGEGLNRFPASVRTRAPDVTILMEGTNDVTQDFDENTIVFNLRQTATLSVAAGNLTYIASILPRKELRAGFTGERNEKILRVNQRLRAVARDVGASFIDVHAAFVGWTVYYSDKLHPNERGYGLMADTYFLVLRPLMLALLNQDDIAAAAADNAALRRWLQDQDTFGNVRHE